ncbi:MAG: glycosyltransferase family 2 protein [Pseudomonadota bacterium]
MDLSIVIVNWNTRAMLRDCLHSVCARLAPLRAEIWVVDNASVDGSPQMVSAEFPRVNLIRNQENRGFAAANNQALCRARGRHVLLLNSDTLVRGDVLAASVRYLDQNPHVGAMGCRVLNGDESLQITCSRYPSLLNLCLQATGLNRLPGAFFDRYRMTRWQRREARRVDVISGCFLMVRRAAMEQVGVLDERFFFYGEETDWCRRLNDAGWRLMLAPVGEIIHFGGGSAGKLNHRRNLMLSEGTIRYHRKHNGMIGGAACWALLAGFNLSRAIGWTCFGLAAGGPARETGRAFQRIVSCFGAAWPRKS